MAWLALPEIRRIALVAAYHRAAGIETVNLEGHAAAHAAVESQLAIGVPAEIGPALARLLAAELGRHDAIHVIAGELLGLMDDLLAARIALADFNAQYARALNGLSAAERQPSDC